VKENISVPMARPSIGKDEKNAILDVFDSNWLAQGKITENFEKELSKYLSSNVTVVNNGSSAILCGLLAHGIKPGDKIIVPSFTYLATSSVPKILGAQVIPVDIDPNTLNVSIDSIEKIVKKQKIKMVIVVDVAGLPTDLDVLIKLSKKYNFILFEDAAEALGSEYKNKKLGSFAHTTIFSFHIAKQITTIEGGCITTLDKKLHKKIQAIRDMGRIKKGYVHDYVSSNFRTTDIQSAIGLQQLKKIDNFIKRRERIANIFKTSIKQFNFQLVPEYASKHTYMLFFVFAKNKQQRNKIVKKLRIQGIDARLPWLPVHMQPCNPELKKHSLKNVENIFDISFTMPIFNSMTDNEIKSVVNAFK